MLQRRFLLQVRVGIKKELRRHRVWGYGGETDMILLLKEVIVIFRHSFYCSQHTDSRVAQWKRAGPITQRSMDRNHPLLHFFFLRTHDVPYPTRKGYGTEKRAGPISAEDSALDF